MGKGSDRGSRRVREEHEAGRVTAAVVLVKAATDTRWFRVGSPRDTPGVKWPAV